MYTYSDSLYYTAESSMAKQVYSSKKMNPTPGRKAYLLQNPTHTGSPDNHVKCSAPILLELPVILWGGGTGSHDLLPCVTGPQSLCLFSRTIVLHCFSLLYIISESLSFISSENSSARPRRICFQTAHHENKGTIW